MLDENLKIVERQGLSMGVNGGSKFNAPDVIDAGGHELTISGDVVSASDLAIAAPHPSGIGSSRAGEPAEYSMRLLLSGMNAGYQARVTIYETDGDGWVIGDRCDLLVGVSVNFPMQNVYSNLGGFLISSREFFICVNQTCERIDVCLYVRAVKPFLRGSVQLPQGGGVTIESSIDRANLTGAGSFGIALY